jgi:hypothetical protein
MPNNCETSNMNNRTDPNIVLCTYFLSQHLSDTQRAGSTSPPLLSVNLPAMLRPATPIVIRRGALRVMSPVKSRSISSHFEAEWKSGSPEKKRKRSCYFETLWSKYVVDGKHRSKQVRIWVENTTRAAGLPIAFKARPRTGYVSPIQRWGIRKVQKRTAQRQRRVWT